VYISSGGVRAIAFRRGSHYTGTEARIRPPYGGRKARGMGRSNGMAKSILVIDDETLILDAIKIIFEDMGYEVETVSDFDLILTDIRMPGRNGAEITEAVLAKKPKARILCITAYPNDPVAERAVNAGAVGLLKKPFEIAKILDFLA
jgi:CheY-like chemotaxis protein